MTKDTAQTRSSESTADDMDEIDNQILKFQEKLELINRNSLRSKLRPNYGLEWIEELRRRL